MGFNQRRYPRVKADLNICFWRVADDANQPACGETLNLSENGVAFETRARLEKQDLVVVELTLPAEARPIKISAKVVFCQIRDSDNPVWEVHLAFLEQDSLVNAALRRFVAAQLGPTAGPAQMSAATAVFEERKAERAEARMDIKYRELDDAELAKIIGAKTHMPLDALSSSKYFNNMMAVLAENISSGGLKLLGDLPFHEGKHMLLELSMPELPMPIQALAAMLWASDNPEVVPRYSSGVKFSAIRKEDALKVEKYVAFLKAGKH